MHFEYNIEGGDFAKAGFASSQIKKVLKGLNVDYSIIKKIVVALYESEMNIVAHAYRGRIMVDIDEEKVFVRLTDEGPGIPDIGLAMKEGFSTASEKVRAMGFGAGMGLSNIKKNTSDLFISSEINKGTLVEFVHYLKYGTDRL